MRITAGELRHRIIEMTNLETTRETQDKVRMAIYNLLGQYFQGGTLLDLFAVSGAMAIEGYSRGFSKIVMNDLNKKALDVCKKNCKNLGITSCEFYNMDYKDYMNTTKDMFDLIILDPPYRMDNIIEILDLCIPKLSNKGVISFEMDKNTKYPLEYKDLKLIKDKTYGIKRVVIYRR